MKRALAILSCGAVLLLAGCAPPGDISGWELVPKTKKVEHMEVFPELPVRFPDTTPAAVGPALSKSPIAGAYLGELDQDSLYRRGYSAPTP